MNNNFTISDIVKILNSVKLWDVDTDHQIGYNMISSKHGDLIFADDIASAFGVDFRYVDGGLQFVEKK